jgi:hypothetical protein
MKPRKRQSVAALVALACALLQAAAAEPGLAGTLAFAHDGEDHTHAVSIRSDAGHFDLVLSHEHPAGHASGAEGGGGERAGSCSEPDHVVHLGDADASCQSTRPHGAGAAPLGAVPFEPRCAEPPRRAVASSAASRVLAARLHRSVVLQL